MKYNYNTAVEKLPNRIKEERTRHNLTQLEVADKIHVDKKTYEKYEHGKTFPPVQALIALCGLYDCEPEYLLGFQEHKKKEIGSVTNITGLSEEVVESLAKEVEFKKTFPHIVEDELTADAFLEYLILNESKAKLLQRIRQERTYIRVTGEYRKNPKSYQIAKSAFDEAHRMAFQGSPIFRLFSKSSDTDQLREFFITVLAGRLEVNREDVDKWAINEFGQDAHFLVGLFELEQARAERLRVIEDCFSDLVKEHLREEENNAEK